MYETGHHHLTSRIMITSEIRDFLQAIPRQITGSIFVDRARQIVFSTRSPAVAQRLQSAGFDVYLHQVDHSQHRHACHCALQTHDCGQFGRETFYRVQIAGEV